LASGEVDPFAVPGEERSPSEADARVVTKEGRRTLEILRTEKIDSVKLVTGKFEEGFEIVKDRLAKHGIEVRIMKGRKPDADDPLNIKPASVPEIKPASMPEVGYFLKLEGATIERFMKMLDQMAVSGWILYPDGSITYFENQCCGRLPKDGIYCHDSQYEAGKPEVMKAASEKRKAEQSGADQPATKPADKPTVNDQPSTPTSKDSPR
jgi:hypothetical protein